MKVTQELISKGKTKNNGYTKRQLEILGVSWPPKAGWKNKVLGTEISDNDAKEFLAIGA